MTLFLISEVLVLGLFSSKLLFSTLILSYYIAEKLSNCYKNSSKNYRKDDFDFCLCNGHGGSLNCIFFGPRRKAINECFKERQDESENIDEFLKCIESKPRPQFNPK